jgi:transposase
MNIAALSAENARLKALLAQTQAALAEVEEARRRLEMIVGELRRDKFGAKSEKLSADRCNLPLEDVEIAHRAACTLADMHARAKAMVGLIAR